MPADVLVTGIGIVSPAGIGCEQTWRRLLAAGKAACRLAGGWHPKSEPVCAAPIGGFSAPAGTEHLSRTSQLAVAAAEEALASARLADRPVTSGRMAASIGTSKPLVDLFLPDRCDADADTRLFFRPSCGWFDFLPDAPARTISARFGLALVHSTVCACSTGLHAIIRGAEMIRNGEADIVLAGGADSSLSPLWLAAYQNMGVLAPEHPELGPAWACRPFDRYRNGFVVGEGAALLVLESRDSVTRRGVSPWAWLRAWAIGSDPAGLTRLSEDGSPLAEVVQTALNNGSTRPADVCCIYAHGTATRQNDLAEVSCFRRVFGRHLTSLPVISTKGAIGHLMGAAGAVETALAVLAGQNRRSPGTATLVEPDPEFAGLRLPTGTFDLAAGAILKTSLGFGGHLAAIVVQRPERC
ncbi:MAG: beta-ketoacyl-[acyl-carrier-protein] synthase family protein [Phycisphaerae bacterium]